MADPALDLLNKLFERWQRADNNGRTLSLSLSGRDGPAYRATFGVSREDFHATMENAAKCGAVRLKRGRFETSHELIQVALDDGHKLAGFLGRAPAEALVAAMALRIAPLLERAPPWLHACWDNAAARWRRGETALRLRLPQHADEVERLFKALLAVSRNQQDNLDLRSFSVLATGDSKAMERLKASFIEAWRAAHDGEGLGADDLYQVLGLIKSPQPILLRGAVELHSKNVLLDLSGVFPWIGLPGETLRNAVLPKRPDYVLSIENWASFARHCREVRDHGLILYTGGFPNPSVQSLLQRFGQEIEVSTAFYHWGDTDVRGLEILALVAKLSGRTIYPHLMDRAEWAGTQTLTQNQAKTLENLRDISSLSTLITKLITMGIPQDFEQESQMPKPPKA